MNVAFDPWIPVVTLNGVRQLVSVDEVLTNGDGYSDLAVRPHERVSLMRLFLCVAHAALNGPKDYKEWKEVPARLPEAARNYLKEWEDSFELFHKKKPWLQIADLKSANKNDDDPEKTSPIALLDFELATGNNSTLNDHGGQAVSRQIRPERMALILLTFQNFSSGGGSPVAQWKGVRTSQVGNPDAPCLSQSMAHCLFRGRSLFETIYLNLPTFEAVERTYKLLSTNKKKDESYTNVATGRPVWEFFPNSPNEKSDKVINATRTYLGRLVPISRWIRLIPDSDRMLCCNGFKYDTFRDGFAAEPTASVREVKKYDKKRRETQDRLVVRVYPLRAVWRELSALLLKRTADGLGGPLAMTNAPDEFDFYVCGLARDQASMDIAIESVFHVRPTFRDHLATYQAEIQGDKAENILGAEGYAIKLRDAVEEYRLSLDADWNSRVMKRTQPKERNALRDRLAQTALLSYWTAVEKNLFLLFAHIEAIGSETADSTLKVWRKTLFKIALEAYRVACGQETPRQMRAFTKGWQKLTGKKEESELSKDQLMEENS